MLSDLSPKSVLVVQRSKAAYPAVTDSPTAALDGRKGYVTHASLYGSWFELFNISEAIEVARSEAVASAIAENCRSVHDGYIRERARKLLQAAIECEVVALVEGYVGQVYEHGQGFVVRNG